MKENQVSIRNIQIKWKAIITFWMILLFISSASLHFKSLKVNGPLELREDATVITTSALLKNINPFSLENSPEYINVHGILYNLLVFPFAKIFGSTYLIHRIVSAFFIFFSCLLIYIALIKEKIKKWIALLATFLYYAQLVVGSPIGLDGGYEIISRPDSLGLFLFLASILVPYWLKFSLKGLSVGLVLSILAFFAKPYFFLGAFAISTYLFITISKRRGLAYFLIFLLVFFITAVTVNKFADTYFFDTLFIHQGIKSINLKHLYKQLKVIFIWNISAVSIIILMLSFIKLSQFIQCFKKKLVISSSAFNQPLLVCSLDYFAFLLTFFSPIVILVFGPHMGNTISYFSHLMTPFLIILAFKNIVNKKLKKDFLLINLAIMVNISLLIFNTLPYFKLIKNNAHQWQWWEEKLGQAENIYNSPSTALLVFNQGKRLYDNGHSEHMKYGLSLNDKIHLVKGAREKLNSFNKDIRQKIENQEFDMIIIGEFSYPEFTIEDLQQTYVLTQSRRINLYKQSWIEQIWRPKENVNTVNEKNI